MTGPEHYAEAESQLIVATEVDAEDADHYVARAQVHATLALAAAAIHSELAAHEVTAAWQDVAAS
jgi:hypothetical protein